IESDKAIKRTIVKTVSASGVIEPVKKVNISSSISANIIQLLVKEGQSVKKGDLLARLDRETITAEVEQQTAALSQQRYSSNTALLQMKQIQLDFDNKVKLKENNFISDNDFDNTKLSLDIAKTNYESSLENIKLQTAYLDQAKDKLNKTNIYAPLDGSIIKLYKEQGEMVLGSQFNNDIILSIADLNAFKVNVKVDENDVALISVADSVKITIDAMGEMIFKGTVTEIGNTPLNVGSTESSIEYNVSVDMITKDDRIKPGMTTYAEIITDIVKDVLSVPIQSLARRKKSEIDKDSTDTKIENSNIDWRKKSDYYDVIFRLNKKDKAEDKVYEVEMVKIKTGIANDRYIEITEGLNENDLIVSGDYQTISKVLKDGMTVKEK
ncbi:MAG: efflux RND transporter periplasmic adaptor subunit, partial [Candidatus Delongbacteria bacterium]|nr:efflux RND transporter periplasmic adaptor subunit [Candidatus Delongbacteria bacterium]MCG2759969.1 efflux RND transporter periplasmic adaptor subunit [Candidatus Delongbacteria bacterium]